MVRVLPNLGNCVALSNQPPHPAHTASSLPPPPSASPRSSDRQRVTFVADGLIAPLPPVADAPARMSSTTPSRDLRVSVCIPTNARPELIVRAIGSVLAQSKLPYEILIGDDSDDDATAETIERLQAATLVPMRLFRNRPRLGQGRNVGKLIAHASGDAILLLHDDDRIEPRGIETLARALSSDERVVLAFGKSWAVDIAGKKNRAETTSLNEYYYRTPDRNGIVRDTLVSAALQQVPGSGFLVRTEAARAASYDKAARYHNACDYVFNVELALRTEGAFYFCDEYVHCYHRTPVSLSRSPTGNSALMAFAYAHSLRNELDELDDFRKRMRERSTLAIGQAARLGHLSQAAKWFFGPYHRGRILSPWGVRSAMKIVWAFVRGRQFNAAKPTIPEAASRPVEAVEAEDYQASGFESLGRR